MPLKIAHGQGAALCDPPASPRFVDSRQVAHGLGAMMCHSTQQLRMPRKALRFRHGVTKTQRASPTGCDGKHSSHHSAPSQGYADLPQDHGTSLKWLFG
jgi:hypothetical protein